MIDTNKSKKRLILSISVLNLILIISLSFAYFSIKKHPAEEASVGVETSATDEISFEVGDDINIQANIESFGNGMGNIDDTTTAKAILKASKEGKNVTSSYNLYYKINNNDFIYTSMDRTPELLLEVYAPGENTLYSIDGLTPTTVGSVTGYDITTTDGVIKIAEEYPIAVDGSVSTTTEQEWTVKITFVNLDTNQAKNANKFYSAKLIIKQESGTRIVDVCGDDSMAQCIRKNYQLDDTLYFHDKNTDYPGAHDDSVRYTGGEYKVSDRYSDTYSNVFDVATTSNGLIKFYCSRGTAYSLVGKACDTATYTAYYYLATDPDTHYDTKKSIINYAYQNGYITDNVNNYVCFGTDAATCDDNHTFRIIGVFKDFNDSSIARVKLIKAYYATTTELGTGQASSDADATNVATYYQGNQTSIKNFYWSGSSATSTLSTWGVSDLKKVAFETNYISYLTNKGAITKWTDMIATPEWKVGGANSTAVINNFRGFSDAYNSEITLSGIAPGSGYGPSDKLKVSKYQIGLMYVSDYLFSFSKEQWSLKGNAVGTTYRDNSWLYTGHREWTQTRNDESSTKAVFYINYTGVVASTTPYTATIAVRPTFYLNENVKIASGTGEKSNPYRVELNL